MYLTSPDTSRQRYAELVQERDEDRLARQLPRTRRSTVSVAPLRSAWRAVTHRAGRARTLSAQPRLS